MELEWDEAKRQAVLAERGVDFADAEFVLQDERAVTAAQDRGSEVRYATIGMGPAGRLLTVVWTRRGTGYRVITAWKSNARERKEYGG
jgi:uncharacterized DUF497 family protein